MPTKNVCKYAPQNMCCVVFIIRSRQGNVNINFRAFVTAWKVFLCCYYLSFTWPLHITPHIQLLNCPWIELSFTLSVAIHSVQTDIIIQLELGKSTAWIHAMKKMFDSKKTQALKKLRLGRCADNQNGNLRWYLPWGGGGLEGVSSATYLFWKMIFLKNHLESLTDCENVFCT